LSLTPKTANLRGLTTRMRDYGYDPTPAPGGPRLKCLRNCPPSLSARLRRNLYLIYKECRKRVKHAHLLCLRATVRVRLKARSCCSILSTTASPDSS
jgi:hypothetical protein